MFCHTNVTMKPTLNQPLISQQEPLRYNKATKIALMWLIQNRYGKQQRLNNPKIKRKGRIWICHNFSLNIYPQTLADKRKELAQLLLRQPLV